VRREIPRRNLLYDLSASRRSLLRELGTLADKQGLPIYLVGGVVRDLLLRKENWDLDITVEGDGIAFARLVADRYGAGVAFFERFATARLVLPDGLKLDIASTRRESYVKPAALPDVAPASLKEDLYRRDFTINAMVIQLNPAWFGRLYDPYGGQRDLKAGTIRVLHEGSFIDDPTRIFRAIRFAERFGFHLEPATSRLLRQAAATNLVRSLSGPRLCNEIFLLMKERDPGRMAESLARLKLLRFLHPRLRYTKRAQRIIAVLPRALAWWKKQCSGHPVDQPLLYLMALLSDAGPSIIRSVSHRLQMSSVQMKTVEWAGRLTDHAAYRMLQGKDLRPSQVYRLLAGISNEGVLLVLAKTMAMKQGKAPNNIKQSLSGFVLCDAEMKPWLTGRDLASMGLRPGPRYTQILNRLRDARLDGTVRTADETRALAQRLVRRVAQLSSAE
jgi:tRNA nucleotidyltransferase (CCA-adding enzyme)